MDAAHLHVPPRRLGPFRRQHVDALPLWRQRRRPNGASSLFDLLSILRNWGRTGPLFHKLDKYDSNDWRIRGELAARYPGYAERVFLFGEVTPGTVEIADPYGKPVEAYRRTYRDVDRRIGELAAELRGRPRR